MNHKEELNLLKEQIALLNVTENEDILEKINKTVERMEFSPLFKPYGLFFEEYKENEVEILNTHKLMPTQLDDLLIEKDLNKPVNLLLEGDNYQALKLLEKTHKEKIDVIYIDPPYNTGNKDFVYNDAYVNNEDAFRHSKWLSFMDKRLKLAKKLLTQDGVIFISIDDNEQSQLKLLCDQVFGEKNFISTMPRKTVSHIRKTSDSELQNLHDYILVYAKIKDNLVFQKKIVGEKNFNHEDSKGKYQLKAFQNSGENGTRTARPNLYYPIYYSSTKNTFSLECVDDSFIEILPNKVKNEDGRWLWSREKFNKDKGILEYYKNKIYRKEYDFEVDDKLKYQTYKTWLEDFPNREGSTALADFGLAGDFTYPKSTELISFIISLTANKNATILDFFAGSGTTGQAVLELNKEDGGNRQFILATNNEVSSDKELQLLIDKGLVPQTPEVRKGQPFKEWKQAVSDFKETIAYAEFLLSEDYLNLGIARQVTYERLKRVINGYTTPKGKVIDGLPNNLKYIRLDKVTNLDAKKGVYSQKDAVFYFENVMEDLDAEYFKGESKDKVVYVVGDEEEIDNLLSDLKNSTPDKEVFIYTNIVLINQFKHLEDNFTFKKFPNL